MPYDHTCAICKKDFVNSQPGTRTCSPQCKTERKNNYYGCYSKEGDGIGSQKGGKVHELLVCCELVKAGYDVYYQLTPQCKHDVTLLHRKTDKLIRLEVKTGYRSETGKVIAPKHAHSFDVMAVLLKNTKEILYFNKDYKPLKLEDLYRFESEL